MSQLYEMQQLEKIRGICEVAQQDMAKLPDVSPLTLPSTSL
jgi:DNA-binding XRE family transcriptional regulator